jgi:hypothetical protein
LEYEKREPNGLNFIKVHAPLEVLRRYSEILKLRMPMREVMGLFLTLQCLPDVLCISFFIVKPLSFSLKLHVCCSICACIVLG